MDFQKSEGNNIDKNNNAVKLKKKIAVSTWCTDDYAVYLRPDRLEKCINHFHPEIDFHQSLPLPLY